MGIQIHDCSILHDNDKLYMVPENRLFIWPGHEIGYKVEIPHVISPSGLPIFMETISFSPKIFRIYNLISSDEANELIYTALNITDDEHKLKRSSTGAIAT